MTRFFYRFPLAALLAISIFAFVQAGFAQPAQPASPSEEIKAPGGPAPAAPAPGPAPAGPAAPREPASGPPAPVTIQLVEPREPDTVIAHTAHGDITMKSLFEYYALYLAPANAVPIRPAVDPNLVPQMPGRYLDKLARSMAIAMTAEKAAAEITDPAIQAQYEKDFNAWLVNYSMPQVRKAFIDDKMTTPSQESVRNIYEANKAAYQSPFQFNMRHIFLRTLDPYTVRDGDSLESIAKAISGDPKQAANILADVDAKPRRGLYQKDPSRRIFKPLVKDEGLLVPMHPDRFAAVRKAIDQMKGLLDQGRSFEELAAKFSQNDTRGAEIGPLPSGVAGGRGLDPKIIEAAKKMKVGEISPVIQTRTGFVIFKLTSRTEAGTRPFESVAPEIVKNLRERQSKKLEKELIDFMFAQPELQIDMAMFADTAKRQKTDIVLRVGDQPFTWGEVESTWEHGGGKDLKTREDIVTAMRDQAGIFNALGLVWCLKNNLFVKEGMDVRYKVLRTGVIGATHIKNQIEAIARSQVSEEAVKKFYEDHKDQRYRMPSIANYQIIERKPPEGFDKLDPAAKKTKLEEMRTALDAELAAVKKLPDFIKLAQATNPPLKDNYAPGVLPYSSSISIDSELLGGQTGEWLRKLKPREWSPALIEPDRVRAVALLSLQVVGHRAYAETRNDIIQEMLKNSRSEAAPKLEQQWSEASKYEFVLGPDKPVATPTPAPEKTEKAG